MWLILSIYNCREILILTVTILTSIPMKKIYTLLLIAFCTTTLNAQKIPISLNGNYRTEAKDWGIGTQVMIPVYKSLYIAPSITYFFEKEYNDDAYAVKTNVKNKSLNYGVDMHYAFYLKNTRSFVSPFVGIEGMSSWSKVSGSNLSIYHTPPGSGPISSNSEWNSFGGDFSAFDLLGNIGIAGKWFLDGNFFLNTQMRYSIVFDESDSNHFVFTGGIGYVF